jgi:hypothetical protein
LKYNFRAVEVYLQPEGKGPFYGPFPFSAQINNKEARSMAKRQRVFQRGKEYVVTGAGKRVRRLVFVGEAKLEHEKQLFHFRPVRKMKKHRS